VLILSSELSYKFLRGFITTNAADVPDVIGNPDNLHE
jgi:hypothetical protein